MLLRVLTLVIFNLFIYSEAHASLLISKKTYSQLSVSQQKQYIDQLRFIVEKYEKLSSRDGQLFAERPDWLGNFLVGKAYAYTPGSDMCAIGGLFRKKIGGKCPTFGRGCEGQTDGFKCGVIYGGLCVSRTPINGLSERCHDEARKNQIYPTAEAYGKYRNLLLDHFNDSTICDGGKIKYPPCQYLQERLEELDQKFNEDFKPDKIKNTEDCYRLHDQLDYGTCHAFCTLCLNDKIESASTSKNKGYRSSPNWAVFSSAMVKICDGRGPETWKRGGFASQNVEAIKALGYCNTDSYHPYDMQHRVPGTINQYQILATKFLDSGQWQTQYYENKKSIQDEFYKVYKAAENAGLIKSGEEVSSKTKSRLKEGVDATRVQFEEVKTLMKQLRQNGVSSQELPSETVMSQLTSQHLTLADEFQQQFGIHVGDAQKLICKYGGTEVGFNYPDVFAFPSNINATDRFRACVSEAMKNARKVASSCQSVVKEFKNKQQFKESLVKQLELGLPLSVAMILPENKGHGRHCVAIEKYDKERDQFRSINSWGKEEHNWNFDADFLTSEFGKCNTKPGCVYRYSTLQCKNLDEASSSRSEKGQERDSVK